MTTGTLGHAAAAALLAAVLTSCGDGEAPSGQPTRSSSVATTDPAPSASEPAPGPDAASGIRPATGPRLRVEQVSLRAPEGFEPVNQTFPFVDSARGPTGVTLINLAVRPAAVADLDVMARIGRRSAVGPPPDRRRDTLLGGAPAYHLAGTDRLRSFDEFGGNRDGVNVTVQFVIDSRVPAGERREIIESVLASFSWG